MYRFGKKNANKFLHRGPHENVWGPRENLSPGPAVALDGPSDESNGLVTDNVYCLVKITEKDERIIAAVQFKIKLSDFFSTGLNSSSLIIFIPTYTVNYRNALDRLRVHNEHYLVRTGIFGVEKMQLHVRHSRRR